MRDLAVAVSNDNENVSVQETIRAIEKSGFKNVFIQWYDKKLDFSQEEQVKLCQSLNLNIIFAHLGYQNINSIWLDGEEGEKLVDRYKDDIKKCKEYDIPMVVMHLTSHFEAPKYSEIGLERLKKIISYAKELGMKVAFENTKIKCYLEYVLKNIKDENVGVCFDSGHCHVHFDDEFNFEFFKDRIFAVHLHDNDKSDDLHLMPFDGTIDWQDVLTKLKKANYTGFITLELCYRYDYLNMPIDEFYKLGYERAEKVAEIYDKV